MPSSPEAVQRRLVQFRTAMGLSAADVCRATGFSSAQLAQYENTRRISIDAAIIYCKVFGLSLDWIFLGDRSGLPQRIASKLPPE